MLTRLYIDNYKCFSNFELTFGPLQLLLGDNGTGKSSVLDVMAGLQMALTSGKQDLDEWFPLRTITRWDSRTQQTFELDVDLEDPDGGVHPIRYRLELEHFVEEVSVAYESLSFDGKPVYKNDGKRAEVFLRNAWKEVLVDPFTSALAKLPVGVPGLARFRDFMEEMLVLRPRPSTMSATSTSEDDRLTIDGSNFSAWYRALDPQQPFPTKQALHERLGEALSGFESLVFSKTGENERVLKSTWRSDGGSNSRRFELGLDELSDGQRMLILLHTLLSLPKKHTHTPRTILLDEPTNYVSLSEIEPWLREVEERTEGGTIQALVASHHPELINAWASTSGIRFDRQAAGPVRAKRFETHEDDPLPPAERIARGWDDEDA